MHLTRRILEIRLLLESVIVPWKNRHRVMLKLHKQLIHIHVDIHYYNRLGTVYVIQAKAT